MKSGRQLLVSVVLSTVLSTLITACGSESKEDSGSLPTIPDDRGGQTTQPTTTTLPVTTTLPGTSTTAPVTTTTSPVTTTTTPVTTTVPPTTTLPPTTTTQPPVSCQPIPGRRPAGTITINNGLTVTKTAQVNLKLEFAEPTEMRISNDSDCRCGTWEAYSPQKVWTLGQLNQQSNVSVQFKDYDGVASHCAKAQILHDSLPPTLSVSLDPTNTYKERTDVRASFQTEDLGVGLKSVKCWLNSAVVSCGTHSGTNYDVNLGQLAMGSYIFQVESSDLLDHSLTREVRFEIQKAYKDVEQSVDIIASNKVDVLFVVDNSGSMAFEQQSMAQRMGSFMNQIIGLDYRIGITTTDPSSREWGDGRLLPLAGQSNRYVVDASMPQGQAQALIGNTLQRRETGNASEQGIYATYRAIERTLASGSNPNKLLFRPDAGLAVVVISDEDESATGPKNIPENLVNYVQWVWPGKLFSFHSIITIPGDDECRRTQGAAFGVIYEKMSRITGLGTVGGAIVGSVCASDYGAQLSGIGDSVRQMNKAMTLQCEPVGPSNSSVVVRYNGANFTDPYEVIGTKLVFQRNLPLGRYTLTYRCAAP